MLNEMFQTLNVLFSNIALLFSTVDDMRQQALMQMGTHQFVKEGIPVGRVEYLPIEWYSKLHSDRHGVDK